MKKLITAMAIVALAIVPALPAGATSCANTWGSLPKTGADTSGYDTLQNVRTGRNTCYDRMVFDLSEAGTGYDVRYVTNVYTDGEGALVPLTGGAKLQIVIHAPSYDPLTGNTTYSGHAGQPLPGVNLTGYQTFRDAKFAGSFEGQSTVGLGVRAKLPFRVLKLDNRVIVDVAHTW